jgi:hypothetical protein
MAGKGSRARPLGVSKSQFDDNWDKIFNKKDVAISEDLTDNELQELANQIVDADREIEELAIELKNKS